MKFKKYSREYERVFTGDELILKKCNVNDVTVFNDVLSIVDYQNKFKETVKDFYSNSFDNLIKMVWLSGKFCYRGFKRKTGVSNGTQNDRAFGVYTRHFIGYDNRFVMGSLGPFCKVASYFEDFFPNFHEGNPFEEEYKYPYKHMTLECLVVVYKMPERLDLLAEGEKEKMSYTEFLDYVLNYINCYNAEHGDKYIFAFSYVFMPYIKII